MCVYVCARPLDFRGARRVRPCLSSRLPFACSPCLWAPSNCICKGCKKIPTAILLIGFCCVFFCLGASKSWTMITHINPFTADLSKCWDSGFFLERCMICISNVSCTIMVTQKHLDKHIRRLSIMRNWSAFWRNYTDLRYNSLWALNSVAEVKHPELERWSAAAWKRWDGKTVNNFPFRNW